FHLSLSRLSSQRCRAPPDLLPFPTRRSSDLDDVLLHLAAQHPFDHFHGFRVGDAHALHKCTLFADALERGIDLWAAAMYHDRVRSEEHSLNSSHVKISYAVFCLKKKSRMISR